MNEGIVNHKEIEIEEFQDDFDEIGYSDKASVESILSDNYLNTKLNEVFAGKIVRKDLTKKIKEGANVPVYVLEYLLGMYCATTDEESIADGVKNVKSILSENFVRPDEAQKIISKLRERGSYTVIDKVAVKLNYKQDIYEAEFSNLGIKNVPISEKYASNFERLLC